MQNTLTIAGREFRSYFNSPVAYIVLCLSLLALGIAFYFLNAFFVMNRATVEPLFSSLSAVMIVAGPAMTMGLLAEEKRSGTIELLMTMPVRDSEVILGKYLGVLGLYAVLLLLTLPYPISVSALGDLDWGPVVTGYLGIFLYGAAMLGIGLMASSWTRNQLVALLAGMMLCAVFGLIHWLLPLLPSSLASVLEWLSLNRHFQSMARGVIDTRDVIYFVTVAAAALAVAFRSLESRRWR
jgi:ABC-2 type transport system permease protein